MGTYTAILEAVGGETAGYQYYFVCEADDHDHAQEQALNAYPNDLVIKTYQGEPQ
jgi:hypothetical protein